MYYNGDFGLNVKPRAAEPITTTLYLEGEAILGATATHTAAVVSNAIGLTIPSSAIKLCECCRGVSTVVMRLFAETTVTIAAMRVEQAIDYV